MKKSKNSFGLPNPTRNTCKFKNKLMTYTSGEINLQSKQDVICHIAKVKPATSVHYVADAISLGVRNIPFKSNALFKSQKKLFHSIKKKNKQTISMY